jgi:Na+/H+ antiporter NhaA
MAVPSLSPAFRDFIGREAGGAILLLAATAAALVWANLPGGTYESFWATETVLEIGHFSTHLDLREWVNTAAMAVFFLVVGLEISRELTVGELRNPRTVVVPALGAVGGLVVPALIYVAIVHGGEAATGWGIPMSTDTAFLVGILALFGPRCPDQLRLFLLTLAIVDDIGAIIVMAVFYTADVSVVALVAAAALLLVLAVMRAAGVWQLTPYLLVGLVLWAAVFASGVHATLAGVLVGLVIPAARIGLESQDRLRYYNRAVLEHPDSQRVRLATAAVRATVPANDRLQDALHPVSAYVVVPLFGLANAGVPLDGETWRAVISSDVTIGVAVALLAGNAIGISLAAGLALRAGLGRLPGRVRYGHLIGGAVLAGIGFTVSLFITELAFDDEALRRDAKVGILVASVVAGVAGSLNLRYLGERLPLGSIDDDEGPPRLPPGPWLDPTGA